MSVMERDSPLVSALPEARASRMQTAATWLFVLPLLTEGVLPDVVKLQVAGLAVLAFVMTGSGRPLPHRAVERIFLVAAVLTLTVIGYLAFGSWPQGAGSASAYDERAVMWALTYAMVAAYAVLFFRPDILARVLRTGAVAALSLSIAACLFSRATGHLVLSNPAHGGVRMAGTMSEPSAWAPVLGMLLVMAWQRRSLMLAFLALAGLYLADSPTCLLVAAASCGLCAVLAAPGRLRIPAAVALAGVTAALVSWAASAPPQPLLASGNPAEVAAGRLLAGVQAAVSGTDDPQANTRYSNTVAALSVIRSGGWMHAGAGPDAYAEWVAAEYPPGSGIRQVAGANALWVAVLWDFGLWGVAVLALLVLGAAWRIRGDPVLCAVLIPFMVAAMVNSAIPDWTVTGLAVLLIIQPRGRQLLRGNENGRNVPAGTELPLSSVR